MNSFIRKMSARRKLAAIIFVAFIVAQVLARQSPALAQVDCDTPANEIVAENCLPGNPPSQWDISGAGDATIQGFATDISVDQGGVIAFKVDTNATDYRLDIYRLGYYNGDGARFITTIDPSASLPQTQPACLFDGTDDVNLVDCGNWAESASWAVPATAVSGIYIAKLVREDATPGASHITFIVRDDNGNSDLLFQTSDTTWQAYNRYGGYSLYDGPGHAHKVSYNRPFTTRDAPTEDWLFNAEYPMLRWLERNGYDVSYFTDVDSDRNGSEIVEHQVFLSVGHDEYWSAGQRTNVEAARDAGVHLAFFSGNEIYWKTRWEPSTADGGSTAYRTLVSYKEGDAQGSEHYNCLGNFDCDPHPTVWTGLWRQNQTGHDGGQPENSLSGQISWGDTTTAIQVPATAGSLRFWRNAGITAATTLTANTLGYEFDWEQPAYASSNPAGRITLSDTTAVGKNHKMSLYRAPGGALVFGTGTVQWSWGLDGVHDRGISTEDPQMQQAMVNLFADMGVQPGSLQDNLVAATASTDMTAPTTAVVSPVNDTDVSSGSTITISGTASDTGGGVVAAVEVSVDNGATWKAAAGRDTWSYNWTAGAVGTSVTILSRAVDDSGNIGLPSTAVTLNVYDGPGGPILVITSTGSPFSTYFAEILRTEGLNAFTVADISNVDAALLSSYDVVILGEMSLTKDQVTSLTAWVTAGGNLIAMRPDKQLAGLLGLTDASATLSNAYLLVNTASGPGSGIVNETIQFHGVADLYSLNGAAALATFYSDATTATSNPAVTWVSVGANGGEAAAFTYDLAKSVVYTRQGNPAWIDTNGDGSAGPVRADDLFHNGTDPDWINLDKVAIPQADEQQRLLANMITSMNLDNMPLPRFWYFPRGEKAVVVMTADDHASANVPGRLDHYKSLSPASCSVDDWECVRSTVYLYPGTTLTEAQANAYTADGFEIGVHVDTGCNNYTLAELQDFYTAQLAQFATRFPGLPLQNSERTHCIAWSGWAMQPTVKEQQGIRLDTNYYYWPDAWLTNRPGLFTGSGMPMRFANENGAMFDVYQATTQMTDESGQTFPFTIDTLINRALGEEGYYGVFTANMHSDSLNSSGSDAIVASAQSNGVPVISGRQLVTWLDGRNGSAFESLNWNADTLSFSVSIGAGANGLQVMVPAQAGGGNVSGITIAGSPAAYSLQTIKGMQYAIFDAGAGEIVVSYAEDTTPPVIGSVSPTDTATQVPTSSIVTVSFNEPMDAATVNTNTFELRAPGNVLAAATVTYNAATNTATLTPNAALAPATTHLATVKGGASGMADLSGNPLAADTTWSFTTAADNCPCSIWDNSPTVGGNPGDSASYELGVKFRSSEDGFITALRFYKYPENTGTHVGRLWNMSGNLLGSAAFTNETASGWQEVALEPPVAISANTVYIASYGTESGNYAFSANYFTSQGVDNGPLRALSASESPLPGTNGVFNETPGLFPNLSFSDANYWVDAVFATALANDTTPPVISNVSAIAAANGTAVITWNTDEPATSLVEYGTTSGALNLSESNAAAVTSHSITLTGLAANTTYYYKVTSADTANNSATSTEYSFVTPAQVLADTSLTDFGAATATSCYIAEIADGEVILMPTIGEAFNGTMLPTGWSSVPWTGGTSSVSGGQIAVDGARAASDAYYSHGRSLEFVATFRSETYQHVGFGQLLENVGGEYWAMFGTYNTTSGLYARTNNNGAVTNTLIAGDWLGTPHRYRIEWNASQVLFTIDGALVHTADVAILNTMRPLISDYQAGGASVNVDWMHMSPYSSPCSLTSRVFDAAVVVDWLDAQWLGTTPTGAAVTVETRTGDSAIPDGGWSVWQAVDVAGNMSSPNGRYAQYRLTLTTTDANTTPIIEEVILRYTLDIIEIAQFTGFVDLQGRANDSGAVVEVFDMANKAASSLLAAGTSAAGGVYTTAFNGSHQLEVGTSYYFQINRPLFLPTTILVTDSSMPPVPDDWQHSAVLQERPLTTLNTLVLLGGDASNDNMIGLADAACIGGQYGSPTPGVCGAGLADVTGDGAVNIIDLTLMGGNYGKSFSPWIP